jgi:uncharacterized protein (TIGR00369 family)
MKTDDYCFICGKQNPIGLKAQFSFGQGKASSELKLLKEYQGWSGFIHGGIISALLDEACVYAGNSLGYDTVTAELKVRFKNPLQLEEKIIVEAWANPVKSKLIKAKAKIEDSKGKLIAEAECKLIIKEKRE